MYIYIYNICHWSFYTLSIVVLEKDRMISQNRPIHCCSKSRKERKPSTLISQSAHKLWLNQLCQWGGYVVANGSIWPAVQWGCPTKQSLAGSTVPKIWQGAWGAKYQVLVVDLEDKCFSWCWTFALKASVCLYCVCLYCKQTRKLYFFQETNLVLVCYSFLVNRLSSWSVKMQEQARQMAEDTLKSLPEEAIGRQTKSFVVPCLVTWNFSEKRSEERWIDGQMDFCTCPLLRDLWDGTMRTLRETNQKEWVQKRVMWRDALADRKRNKEAQRRTKGEWMDGKTLQRVNGRETVAEGDYVQLHDSKLPGFVLEVSTSLY